MSIDVFGFGPNLVRWVETFYRSISSCVLNNGTCTPYFELQRGVRQGDPLSPYLFIIAAEILAIAIRSKPNIQGLKIGQDEFKLVQYADDLTMLVPDLECAQRVFRLLDQLESCSGLKVMHGSILPVTIPPPGQPPGQVQPFGPGGGELFETVLSRG